MTIDSVLAEVRKVREEYAAQFRGNIHAMMDDIRRRHKESGRTTVARKPKRIEVSQDSTSTHK
jgi:hypothetical protein